jgi:putative transposase
MAGKVQVSAGGVCDFGYDVAWCPKYRRPVVTGPVQDRGEAPIRANCSERGWQLKALQMMPDHVRLFVKAHPKHSPSFVANQLKGLTSPALRAEFPRLRSRRPALWARSYFAATAGAVSAEMVQRYIDGRYERPWRREVPG